MEIRAWQLSPRPLMLSSRLSLIRSTLFSAIPLSFASTDMTSALGCLCCFIPAHIHLQMPSEISVPVTLVGPGEMLPAAVPCLPGCFWGLLWQTLSSLPCVQAGEPHQEGRAGAARAAPRPSLGFGVGDLPWGGHGERRVNCPRCRAILGRPSAAPCCTNSRALNTFLVGRAPAWRRKLLRKCNYSKQQPHAQALQSTPGTN